MLDRAEIDEKLAAGVPYVIRQTIPLDKGKATLMMKSMVILK